MKLHFPSSVLEAGELLDLHGEDAKLLAGGTAFTIFCKLGLLAPDHLVSLARVDGLSGVTVSESKITIGAMTRLRDLELHAELHEVCPVLTRLLKLVANLRVRNVATIGGNLSEGDPTTDPPAILVALGSEVRLVSARGERWVRLEEFFLGHFATVVGPDEILTDIRIPRRDVKASYIKFLSRHAEDRTCLGAAAVLDQHSDGTLRGLSVGLVGGDQVPIVIRFGEDELAGADIAEVFVDVADRLQSVANPTSDSRGSAEYKRKVIPHLVADALARAESGRQEAVRW